MMRLHTIFFIHPKKHEHEDVKGWEDAIKVANFVKENRWCKGGEEANGVPGITWIELFMLF